MYKQQTKNNSEPQRNVKKKTCAHKCIRTDNKLIGRIAFIRSRGINDKIREKYK